MADATPHGNPAVEHAHAPTSSATYMRIFYTLAVITAVEVLTSLLFPRLHIPTLIEVVALLALSFAKGSLVVMYFMHLRFDSRWFSFLFISGMLAATLMMLAFLALFTYKANLVHF